MRLHLFNPEHDLALAFGGERFTPPRAGRELRRCLGFLPAFWADDDDFVMVDDVEMAMERAQPWRRYFPKVRFVLLTPMKGPVHVSLAALDGVEVWGWDAVVRTQLRKAGVSEPLLPTDNCLTAVRCLSSRTATIALLDDLVHAMPGLVGHRRAVTSLEEVRSALSEYGRIVLKAPWSSSGRGVRYVEGETTPGIEGFVRNTVLMQGSIIVEPFYERVLDFGVEFLADGKGWVSDAGLSLFNTLNGAYTGNVLADEQQKTEMLRPYIDPDMVREVTCLLQARLGAMTSQVYKGMLGADMMVVRANGGYALHPCVEVNLRRTMGHVALDIYHRTHGDYMRMQIECQGGDYRLRLS